MAAKNEQPQELDLPVAFYDPKDRPLSSLIKGGFKRGATEAGSAITDLLPSMYYEGTGQHEEALKQLEERKAKLQQAELENPKAFKSYHEVDGFEDAIKYLGENLGEQSALLPYSIGPGIAGRIGAGMLGRRAATKGVEELLAKRAAEQGIKGEEAQHLVANMLEDRAPQALIDRATKHAKEKGLAAGLFAGSGALNIPETYEQIYSETGELHPGLATVFGSGKAALDMMFDQRLLRQLSPAQKDLLVAEAAKKSNVLPDSWLWAFSKEAAKNAALEGGTESAQSMIDTVAQQAAGSKHPFFSPEHVDEWIESGLVGGLTGGAFGAPGAALEAGRNVAEQRQAHEAFLAEQEQKAADEQYRQALTQQQGLPPQVPPTVQPGIQPTPPTVTGVDSEQPTTPPSPTALGAGPGQTQPSVTPTQEDMFAQPPVTGLEAQEDAFPQELKAAQAAPLQPSAEDMFTGPPIKEVQPIKVLDAKTLKSTGLKPISPIYKRLLDVDLSTPEGMELFKSEADRVQKNAKISDATKEKIAGLYGQAFDAFAQQQEMFGPRGGVLKGAAQRVQPRVPGTRGRASVGVPVESRGVSGVSEGAGESDIGGLGSAPPIPPTSGVGEGVSEPTLGATEEPKLPAMGGDQTGFASVKRFLTQTGMDVQKEKPVTLGEIFQHHLDTTAPTEYHELANKLMKVPAISKTPISFVGAGPANEYGSFKPESGKIEIYDGAGWQTVFHEAVHAATVKGYATDAQLKRIVDALYEKVKGQARKDGVTDQYGLTNPLEFLSEALTNPEFQTYLKSIDFNKNLSVWDRLVGAIRNFLKTLRLTPKEINTAMDAVEGISEAVISRTGEAGTTALTREERIGAGISGDLAQTIVPNLPENFEGVRGPFNTVKALDRAITKFPFTGPKQQGVLSQAMTGLGNSGKKFMLDVLPGHALSDAAETQGIFPKGVASSYHRAMQQHDGYMHGLNEQVNEVNAHKFRNAMKVARKQYPTFSRMTNMSTLIQYDPSKANAMQELKQFSMGYIEFNPDGTQKREVVKYFNTIQERNKAIAAHNKNHTEEERAFVHRDAADAETIKDAEKIQAMWDPLNGAWKDLYKSLRNANSEILKTYKSSIGSRIDSLTELDEGQRVIQKKSILTKLAEHGMIEPYFTLGREGDHWLSADIPNPDGVYTEQFTTAFKNPMERAQLETKLKNYVYKIERERNIRSGMSPKEAHDAAMQTAMYKVRVYANVDEINYKNLPSTSVINDILASVKRQSPPQGPNESNAQFNDRTEKFNQITDDILRTVIHALPETSFLKNLQKRKGTAGYNEDVMSTFERKSRNSIRQIANLRFKPNLDAVLKQMKDYTELLGRGDETTVPRDNSEQKLYTEAFTKHANMALKPSISELGRFLKGGVFTGTLGFNISSGLIELSNIPMIAFPYLGAEYGMSNTISALGRAHRLVRGSGKVRKVSPYGAEITGDVESELLKSGKSITNYDPTKGIGARYATAIQIWKDAGQLNRSQLYELLMGSSRTTQLDRLNAMSGWMMHEMGRYNREVSLIAAYELEMAKLKKANLRNKTNPMSEEDMKKSAANTALHNTEMVNGSIAAASAPTLAQNDVGSLIYMYKRFGVSQYYTLIRTAMDAFKYEKDPQMRGALRRRLGYMIGTVGIMSGVRGLPIFGLLAALWGMLKDDDDPDLDTLARSSFGDMLANGIPETVLGLSLSDRTGLSNMIFREPKGDTASFSQWLVESVGGPLPGLADRWLRGYQLFSSGQTERGIEMMMPVSVANIMKGVRYATSGRAESLRGDPVVSDLTLKDSAAQIMGFTPEPVSKAMEFDSKAKGISEAITKKETNAKRKYYMAVREDDQEGMDAARQELLDLGEKHPELEIDEGTVDEILAKSLKTQQQHTDRMFGGKEYPKKHMDRIRQMAEDWDYSTGPEGELVEE